MAELHGSRGYQQRNSASVPLLVANVGFNSGINAEQNVFIYDSDGGTRCIDDKQLRGVVDELDYST